MVIILFITDAQYPPSLSEGPSVLIQQNPASIDTVQGTDMYCIAGMFHRIKVSFLKEKTIFVGFISVCLFRSLSNIGCHFLTS